MNRQTVKLLNSVAKHERKRAMMLEKIVNVYSSSGKQTEENLYELTHRRVSYGGLTRLRHKMFGATIADIPKYRVIYGK